LTNPEILEKSSLPNGKETLFYQEGNPNKNNNNDPLIPIYPETRGITSGWFYYHIKKLISEGEHERLADPIPEEILKKYNFLPFVKGRYGVAERDFL
jgi:RecG-like helicase